MTTEDLYKKFLLEAEVEEKDLAAASKILSHLHENPAEMGVQNPPPGYEDHLLAALRRKLPPERVAPAPRRRSLFSPVGWGWATAAAFCGLLALVFVQRTNFGLGTPKAVEDKNYAELVGADPESAQTWLAIVGDASVRFENSQKDIHGMAVQAAKDSALESRLIRAIAQWGY